jgi:hypothetical protein
LRAGKIAPPAIAREARPARAEGNPSRLGKARAPGEIAAPGDCNPPASRFMIFSGITSEDHHQPPQYFGFLSSGQIGARQAPDRTGRRRGGALSAAIGPAAA